MTYNLEPAAAAAAITERTKALMPVHQIGLAADMDANAKALVKLDDDWSKAAATKDADRVAAFYADDAIAYPPNEPVAIGRPAARYSKSFAGITPRPRPRACGTSRSNASEPR